MTILASQAVLHENKKSSNEVLPHGVTAVSIDLGPLSFRSNALKVQSQIKQISSIFFYLETCT